MTIIFDGFSYSDNGEWNFALRPVGGISNSAIRHAGWARDASYQAYVTFGDPAVGDYVFQGQRYTADGAAYVTNAGSATGDFVHEGIRRDSQGRMYVTSGPSATGAYVHAGVRRTLDGAVYAGGAVWADYITSLSPAAWFRYNVGVAAAQWNDQSGNNRHLKQAVATNQPAVQADGSLLFDGVDNFMKCDAFTLNQPETVYILFKQITWTSLDTIYDGNATNSMRLLQAGTTPQVQITIAAGVATNGGLALDTYGVIACVFDSASSLTQVNNGTPVTGDLGGTTAGGGFTLGCEGGAGAVRSTHMQVKEVAVFPTAHDATTRARVMRHFAAVGGLTV
jgi:hypothetical protein